MRDFFAILAIILAVLSLGIFRVPDENALVAAGIHAQARAAVYQSRHPIDLEVKGRVITARGRVESEAARTEILAALAAVDGVEEVTDALVLLPEVAPFELSIQLDETGVRYAGHLPDDGLGTALAERFGVAPDLPLGAGAPTDFDKAAGLAAEALAGLLEGRAALRDQTLVIEGQVHLPAQAKSLQTKLESLPEGFTVSLAIEAVDDGKPYALHAVRDARIGLELRGKLPPGFSLEQFEILGDAQRQVLAFAPLPLDQPGFEAAVAAALPVFAQVPSGALTVGPEVVSLSGGPVSPAIAAAAEALRGQLPDGFALHLALVPEREDLELSLELQWDGEAVRASGHVPRDFDAARFELADERGLTRSVYPDLSQWVAPLDEGLAALHRLDHGVLNLNDDGLRIQGVAADPGARALARRALGAAGALDVDLRDDGRPAAYVLKYDASSGGSVVGKLPKNLSKSVLAGALGLKELRGEPRVAPTGDGANELASLSLLRPWVHLIETLTLDAGVDGFTLNVAMTPGVNLDALRAAKGQPPEEMHLSLAEAPPFGTRRMHAFLDTPQIFINGYWLADLASVPSREDCEEMAASLPEVTFAEGRFALPLDAVWPLAEIASIARSCTRFFGQVFVIDLESGGAGLPVLDRQLARRRAETLRAALVERGVDRTLIETESRAGAADRITYFWR